MMEEWVILMMTDCMMANSCVNLTQSLAKFDMMLKR